MSEQHPLDQQPLNPGKLIIIGGVAGGASAAARARRLSETAQIIVLERGPYVSFANCGLPYHLGGDIPEREALLLHTPDSLTARFGLDVRINNEVLSIDRERQLVTVRDRLRDETYQESYDALILAPGAEPIRPPLPGLDDQRVHTLRTLPDLDRLMAALTPKVKHITVVGAGFIGLETVEALRHRGLQVTLLERTHQVLAPLDAEMAALLNRTLLAEGVDMRLNETLESVDAAESVRIQLQSGQSIDTDMIILAMGVRPENRLAKEAGLTIGSSGGIQVNANQQTSDPRIFAVGDAVQVTHSVSGQPTLIPLAGPANRQGRIAADTLFGRASSYRGSLGTAICKLFDQAAGCTGLNEKALCQAGIAYRKLYLHGNDHAGYYPGASMIHLKLLFAEDSGKLLGAQAVGQRGIDKRLDILAVAIQAGFGVDDLVDMELCYAPPYGSAKDIINLAGMAGQNMLHSIANLVDPERCLTELTPDIVQWIDVREAQEITGDLQPGARNLPLSKLRSLTHLIERDRPILVYCTLGLRGYIAQRFLQQQGFQVYSLNGGLTTLRLVQEAKAGIA